MFSINKAKTILNANREEKLNNGQVKQILELLETFARMSLEQFNKQQE